MQSEIAWLSDHALDFETVSTVAVIEVLVILTLIALGVLLMPSVIRWIWRYFRDLH
jgi:hypothetical protein